MSAHADDLRYINAEDIGRTVEVSAGAGTNTELTEALTPGRYALRITDFGGGTDVWVRQGLFDSVTAAAAVPSMQFLAHADARDLNKPLLSFIVRASDRDGLSFFVTGGTGATIQITRVSRGRS